MEVGCTVRAHRSATTTRRAVIATLQESEACLLWEDDTPRPMQNALFLVAPQFEDACEAEEETTVPVTELKGLFDFEYRQSDVSVKSATSIQEWKECGDQLLKAGDAASAVAYYEHALHLSSSPLQVGSTVLIQVSGHAVAAEVDCIDDTSIDVTIVETGHDKTVQRSSALLCILEPEADHLQVRILLNLTRCFLQLAETTNATKTSRRPRYLKSAVLATTLALAVSMHCNDDKSDLTNLQVSALLLRSQVQGDLHKFSHAVSDVKKVLTAFPHHKQGLAALKRLQRQKIQVAKLDKRLAKNVSQWVQTAMNNESSSPVSISEGSISVTKDPSERSSHTASSTPTHLGIHWRVLLSSLFLAWLAHKIFQS